MRRSLAKASPSWFPTRATAALLFACGLMLAAGSSQAQAVPKGTVGFIGDAGTFSTPMGVAVKESTGHVYVVDSGNHRVQEFDAAGMFVRTWGWGVSTGAAAFEVCTAPGPCMSGTAGSGPGQLSSPQGIAVDQTSGNLYVTNQGNRRVEKFGPDGTHVTAFGSSGTGAGQFAAPFTGHVAVDPRNGDVVVADPANRRVQRFDSSGTFLFAFGWGVDTNALALQTCTTASTCQAGRAGSGVGQFTNNQPVRVAVDGGGSVYTVEAHTATGTGNRRVQRFDASATSAGVFAPDHTTGTSAETVPTNVAIDSGNGHVLIAKDQQVFEFNGVADLIETHAAGGGIPTAIGMAVDSSRERIYLSTADQRVFLLGEVTPPVATLTATTEVTATGARFNGTVNPRGGVLSTRYHFEYSDTAGVSWSSLPDVDVGNGITPVEATQVATSLEPNTEYRVRLVASRPFAGGSATSANNNFSNFMTPAAPPDVSGVAAREITDTTAVLAGRIDANHSQTTYQFEYGTDTGYGSATPVDSAGSGIRSAPVVKPITGLQPSTTYHFRLVATNPAGTTVGADQTFTTEADAPQPSGRVYEMVSPLDKNGGDIDRRYLTGGTFSKTGAAPSGEAVAFVSRVQFGDIEAGSLHPNYVARRGDSGWTSEGISPPIGNISPTGVELPSVMALSPDLSKSFVEIAKPVTPDAEMLNGSWGLYLRSSGDAERYRLLSRPWAFRTPVDSAVRRAGRFEYAASTPDSSHVVLVGSRQLLPEAPEDRTSGDAFNAVYEWVDGTVRLVSVLPPGLHVPASGIQGVVAGGASLERAGELPGDHVISDDGRRVFFTASVNQGDENGPTGGTHLWVREDGERTRHITRSQRPGDGPLDGGITSTPRFWGARRADGSVAFFLNNAPLTEGAATGSLYRWDANAPDGTGLTELTQSAGPGALGPSAISDDARSVYFVATGALAAGATPGTAPKLYLWRQGEGVRYIATLDGDSGSSSNDAGMWQMNWSGGRRAARVSADGDRLLFASYAQLDADYDTTEENPEDCGDPDVAGDRCRQIYLYDARAHTISCLTCVPGAAMLGDANLFGNADDRREEPLQHLPLELPRNLSADGTRVFFETTRRLLSADDNSALDVYEWEDSDLDGEGELGLISSGTGTGDSRFLDASLSGDDVFFETRDRLVGIDNDNQVDLYDARVGGGIPSQNPPSTSSCEGEECQGAVSGSPVLAGVGSGGASNGDARPGPRPGFRIIRLTSSQRERLARGRPVGVRVRVNRAGKVSLNARAKVGKRMRSVAKASKLARRRGTVRLQLRLSDATRRELERKGTLAVRLVVRFAGVREAKTSTVRLRRTRLSGEGRTR